MTDVKHLPEPPRWLLTLTNAQLVQHYGAALQARGPAADPHLDRRIQMLDAEIRRRRAIGVLQDDDLRGATW